MLLRQGLGGMGASPEMMQQVMNSPLMQTMMSDPELMRSMLSQNPAISQVGHFCCPGQRGAGCPAPSCSPVWTKKIPGECAQMMERNPDFAQVLNNPQLLRESMQLASNPVRALRALAGNLPCSQPCGTMCLCAVPSTFNCM